MAEDKIDNPFPTAEPVGMVAGPVPPEMLKALRKGAKLANEELKTKFGYEGPEPPLDTPEAILSSENPDLQSLFKRPGGTWSINPEYIDTPEDVMRIMASIAEHMKGPKETVPWKDTQEAARELAKKFALDPSEVYSWMKKDGVDPVTAYAVNEYMVSFARDIARLSKKLASDEATEADYVRFGYLSNRLTALMYQVSGKSEVAGRTMNILQSIKKGSLGDTLTVRGALKWLNKDQLRKNAELIQYFTDEKQVAIFTRLVNTPTFKDMVFEAWISGMLSLPTTHAANTIGNTLTTLYNIPVYGLAVPIGKLRKMIHPGSEPGYSALDYAYYLSGFMDGLRDAARLSWKAAAFDRYKSKFGKSAKIDVATEFQEQPIITGQNVYNRRALNYLARQKIRKQLGLRVDEDPVGKAEEIINRPIKNPLSNAISKFISAMGYTIRTPLRALKASDEIYKALNYWPVFKAEARRMAAMTAETADEVEAIYQQLLENPPPDLVKKAKHVAAVQTFTNDLNATGSLLMAARNKAGLRWLIPFARTITNIAKYAATNSAIGVLPLYKGIKAGGPEADVAIARYMLGVAVTYGAYQLAERGFLIGSGPIEKQKSSAIKKQRMRLGIKSHSIYVPKGAFGDWPKEDVTVPLDRADPLGLILSTVADIRETLYYVDWNNKSEVDAATEAVTKVALIISRDILSKTYATTLRDTLEAVVGGDDELLKRFLKNMAGSAVPNIYRGKVRVDDGVLRDVQTIMDGFCAALADCRAKLPVKYNVWGYEIRPNYSMWNPMSPEKIKKDTPWFDIELELADAGYQPALPPRTIALPSYIGNDMIVEMPPKIYWEYVRERGRVALEYLMNRMDVLKSPDTAMKVEVARKAFEMGSKQARMLIYDKYLPELLQQPNIQELRRKADPLIEQLRKESDIELEVGR